MRLSPLEKPTKGGRETWKSWSMKKGKRAEGIWDLDPVGTEKAEHDFSGQP